MTYRVLSFGGQRDAVCAALRVVVRERQIRVFVLPNAQEPHVTSETFPWSDWRLIAGAVRTDDGQWLMRCGPASSSMLAGGGQ